MEDFGIVPLEAQACGKPVNAYGKGGALETIVPLDKSFSNEKEQSKMLQVCFFTSKLRSLWYKRQFVLRRHRICLTGREIRVRMVTGSFHEIICRIFF